MGTVGRSSFTLFEIRFQPRIVDPRTSCEIGSSERRSTLIALFGGAIIDRLTLPAGLEVQRRTAIVTELRRRRITLPTETTELDGHRHGAASAACSATDWNRQTNCSSSMPFATVDYCSIRVRIGWPTDFVYSSRANRHPRRVDSTVVNQRQRSVCVGHLASGVGYGCLGE